jgi:hypothetical protein
MNFTVADMTPEIELNEILWRSIHGQAAVMPPPRHAAFIKPVLGLDADDWDDNDDAPKPAPPPKPIRR